jgi:hypothetical protein
METNLGNTIIGIVSVLICLGPFLGIYLVKVRKQNKILRSMQESVLHLNVTIGKHEFCGDFLLGMDKNKKYILFYKNMLNGDAVVKIVDLSTIFSCKVLKEMKTVKTARESMEFIEQIELSFISRDKNETKLELFNEERNTQLSGELQCAEKWEQLITELI